MRSRQLRVLAILALTVYMLGSMVAPVSGVIAYTGEISGTIVDDGGTGIENIYAVLYKWNGSAWAYVKSVLSGATGKYSLTELEDGDYQIRYTDSSGSQMDDYAYEWYDDAILESERTTVTVSGGAVVSSIDTTLAAGSTISGVITNERGEPVSGEGIRAFFEYKPGYDMYIRVSVLTDAEGNYMVTGLPAGEYVMSLQWSADTVYKVGYLHPSDERIVVGEDEDVTGQDFVALYADQTPPAISSDIATSYVGAASIEITATDDGLGDSGIYMTYYDLDGAGWVGAATSTVTVDVDQLGQHSITYKAKDNAWNYSEYVTKSFEVVRDEAPQGDEVAGLNRYETAIAASQEGFADDSAGAVVIATGTNWPDALGGSALAGAVGGPLLLTTPSALPSMVEAEIGRVGASEAYIVGGLGAVSQDVEDALVALLGTGNVHRLAGANRYETADEIAAEVIALQGSGYDGSAFCATGGNFPDALAGSAIAAHMGWPILLTPFEGTPTLPAETTDVVILGGTGAVAESTETWIGEQAGITSVFRIGGATRYDTGAHIAEFGIEQGLFWDGVGIAVGDNFPDALSGGAMLGARGTVLLLTPGTTLSSIAESLLADNKAYIESVRFLGGTAAVSQVVRDEILGAVQ